MKYLLLGLFLIPALCNGQYNNLILEGEQVYFEKAYPVDSVGADTVKSMLIASIPKIKGISDIVITDQVITASIKNYQVDLHKYKQAPLFLYKPFDALVSIYWKHGKYRVIVSNMYFKEGLFTGDISNMLVTKGKLDQRKGIVGGGKAVEESLSETFQIRANLSNW